MTTMSAGRHELPQVSAIRPPRSYSIDKVLECSRGIAALWVFMFHISEMFEATSPTLFAIARYGHFGVPLFFVISGYCMFSSAEAVLDNRRTPSSFLKRRLWRVMPPFWFSIALVVAVPYVIALVSMLKSGVFDVPAERWMGFTAMDWLQILTLTRAFFQDAGDPQAAYSPINAVYWTLAIELQFYAVVYVALYFKAAWKRIILAVLGVSLAVFMTSWATEALFILFWPAFVLGMGLCWAHRSGLTPARIFRLHETLRSAVLAALVLAAVLLVMILLPQPPHLIGRMADVVFTAVAALSAVLLWLLGGVEHGIGQTARANIWLRAGAIALVPLSLLGQCSYSLYLLHGKLYQLPSMFLRQVVPVNSLLYPLVTILFTSALCYVFYLLVERPFQSGSGSLRARSQAAGPQPSLTGSP